MKEKSGLEATEEILKKYPDAKILLLTTFLDDEYIVTALKLGAKGYLLKSDYENVLRSECIWYRDNIQDTYTA